MWNHVYGILLDKKNKLQGQVYGVILFFVSMFERVRRKEIFTKLLISVTPGLLFDFHNNFLYL